MMGLMSACALPKSSDLAGLSNFAGRSKETGTENVTNNYSNRTSIRVDAGTGETRITTNQGIAFAKQLYAAVQQVLVREQRPGGSLY